LGIWNPTGSSGVGSGRSLGVATGSIRIDTSQVEQAGVTVKRVSGEITQAFGQAGRGVQAFGKDIQAMRGELVAISLASASFVKLGIDAAQSLRGARIQLRELLGSEAKADAVMKSMAAQANKFGLNLAETNSLAIALLPQLKGNTAELDKWVDRAARLSAKGPFGGTERAAKDATRAVAEFISGQTISLQRLFNINPAVVQEAIAKAGGDEGKALDLILNKIGATEQAAVDMGNTFAGAMIRAKNAATIALDEGFAPILDKFLTPGLNILTEWVMTLSETNPLILEFAAGFTAVAATGAPLLLILGQVITSLEKIRALSIAPSLAKVGLTGLAVAGGVGVGIEATRAIGRTTGNEQAANADVNQLVAVLKQAALLAANSLLDLAGILTIGAIKINEALGKFVESIGHTIQSIGVAIARFLPKEGQAIQQFGADLSKKGAAAQLSDQEWKAALENFEKNKQDIMSSIAKALFPTAPGGATGNAPGLTPGGAGGGPSEDVLKAFDQFQQDMKKIETDADLERIQEAQRYEQARTKLLTDFADKAAKIEAETNQRILDLRQQTQDQILEIESHKGELETKAQDDLNKLDDQFKKEEIKREKDFQRQRIRDLAQHALNLLSAAARLDARAVQEENNRFDLQESQRQEDFDLQTQERQDQLEEQRKGITERLDEQKRADDKRIDQLRTHLNDQERIIRRDEEQRLAELRAQRDRELGELYDKHIAELNQINAHEQDLRAQRQAAFTQELSQLDSQYSTLFAHQGAGLANLQHQFDDWLAHMIGDAQQAFSGASSGGSTGGGGGPTGRALGGPVFTTEKYMLHGSASKPEYVLNPETTASLNRMMGGQLTQAGLIDAVAGRGGNSKSVALGGVQIVLGDIGQHRLPDVKRMVRDGIIEALNEI